MGGIARCLHAAGCRLGRVALDDTGALLHCLTQYLNNIVLTFSIAVQCAVHVIC